MSDKAIVPVDQAGDARMIPMADLERMAEAITQSGLFGIKTVQQALSLMLIAQAEGLHPALAARDYDIIQGKPALKSKAKLARFQRVGGIVKWIVRTDTSAMAEFSHPSSSAPITVEWNMDMAAKAGLAGKDTWKKHPRQMLSARVISEGVDATYPDAGSLMYVPEELQDMSADRIPPSSTGLFDQPPAQSQETAAPIQTTAEVVSSTSATPKDTAQPAQQALPLSPIPQAATPAKMLEDIKARFKDFNAVQVDNFFIKKIWLKPGQVLPELSDENIVRLHNNIDQIVPLCKAWIVQQEKLAENAAKKNEGGSK